MSPKFFKTAWFAVLLLLLVTLFYDLRLTLNQGLIITDDIFASDLMNDRYPVRAHLGQALREGRLPLWTDLIYNGFPLQANPETGITYPPNLLLFGLLPPAMALNASLLLKFFLSGLFLFLLLRRLGAAPGPSLFGGIAFAWSGFFVAHLRHLNMHDAGIWVPLMLYLLERYREDRRWGWLFATGGVFGLQSLAGHPQISYYTGLLLIAYLLWIEIPRLRGGRDLPEIRVRPGARFFGLGLKLGGMLLLGVGLGMVQLLPSYELTTWSERAGGISYQQANQYQYVLRDLLTFVYPYANGDPGRATYHASGVFWEDYGYIGLLPLLLAGYAMLRRFRFDRHVKFFTILAAVSLILMLGDQALLYRALYHLLPGMDYFRFSTRFVLLLDLALCVLAGLGLDRLLRKRPPWSYLALTALLVLDLFVMQKRQNPVVDRALWESVPPITRTIGTDADRSRVYPVSGVESHQATYAKSRGWQGDLSLYVRQRSALQPSANMLYGIPTVNGYQNLVPRHLIDLWGNEKTAGLLEGTSQLTRQGTLVPSDAFVDIVSAFNVKYFVSVWPMPHENLAPVAKDDIFLLIENRRVRPRCVFVRDHLTVGPDEEPRILADIARRGFDPDRVILHATGPILGSNGERYSSSETTPSPQGAADAAADARDRQIDAVNDVRIVSSAPHRVAIACDIPEPGGWLFLADTWYPGWRARVDGREETIYRANICGRAVAVTGGAHEVVFEYHPQAFARGLRVSGISLLVLAAGLILGFRRAQALPPAVSRVLPLLACMTLTAALLGCSSPDREQAVGDAGKTPLGLLAVSDPLWDCTDCDLAVHSDGRITAAWLAYDGRRDFILSTAYRDGSWSPPAEVSPAGDAGPGTALFSPRLAADRSGGAFLVWSEMRAGHFDLFGRYLGPGGWQEVERITEDLSHDTEPAVTFAGDGCFWVAWESHRDGNFDIYARRREAGVWGEVLKVTDDPRSDVQPTLGVSGDGGPYVAWMSWRDGQGADGNYEIYAQPLSVHGGPAPVKVSASPYVDMLPDLVSLPHGLALVWTEAYFSPLSLAELTVTSYDRWEDKCYQVSWLERGRWTAPVTVRLTSNDRPDEHVSDYCSAIAGIDDHEVLLFFGTLAIRGAFESSWRTNACRVRPDGAIGTVDISAGISGPGRPIGAGWAGGQLFTAETAEHADSGAPQQAESWLALKSIARPMIEATRPISLRPVTPRTPPQPEPAGKNITHRPRPRVDHDGDAWTAFYGNLHCHSDYSRDGRRRDGPAIQNLRAAYDVARLDFIALTDHSDWLLAGDWWTLAKLADLWTRPDDFVVFPAYEWTSTVDGHANVVLAGSGRDNLDALFTVAAGPTLPELWNFLGHRRALTIAHHPAHRLPEAFNWSTRNDTFLRLVEIFQSRGNYEYDGAPLQNVRQVRAPFATSHCVRDALGAGHRVGIIASPDHAGGHGLAGVWATSNTREAIFEALHARRCFGTTGARMDLYLEVNGAPLGSEIVTDRRPIEIRASVHGTVPGLRLTVVADGADVHQMTTEDQSARMSWMDASTRTATRYYYLRVEQADHHIGWTSPVWVSPRSE